MPLPRRYPPELDAVLQHAQRLREFIARKERATYILDPGGPWIAGRSGEIQCVVAIVALDWHEGRHGTEGAVVSLNRYLRELHDGLAMHLDVGQPPCCRPPRDRPTPRSPARRDRSPPDKRGAGTLSLGDLLT
jgi:hypothetical protein